MTKLPVAVSLVLLFVVFVCCNLNKLMVSAFDLRNFLSKKNDDDSDKESLEARAERATAKRQPDLADRSARTSFEEKSFFAEDILTTCPKNGANIGAYIRWTNEAGSASMATPLIYDLLSDGRKEIITPTFTHYIEALDGETGRDVYDWPFTHPRLKTQASPLAVDIEPDGISEIMISTYYGELLFFTEEGQLRKGKTIRLPRIIVDRNWSRDFRSEDANGVKARKSEMNWKGEIVKAKEDVTKKLTDQQILELKSRMHNQEIAMHHPDAAGVMAKKLQSMINMKQDVAVRGNQVQAKQKAAAANAQEHPGVTMAGTGRPMISGFLNSKDAAKAVIKKHQVGKDENLILDDSVVKIAVPSTTVLSAQPAPVNNGMPPQDPTAIITTTTAPATTIAVPTIVAENKNNNQAQQQQQQPSNPTPVVTSSPSGAPDRALLFDGDDELPPVEDKNNGGEEFEEFKPPEHWDYDLQHDHDSYHDWFDADHNNVRLGTAGGPLSPEAKASMNLAFHPELFEAYDNGERAKAADGGKKKITAPGEASRMYVDPREGTRREPDPVRFNGKDFDPFLHVYLQPHILATPVVTDLDLDGHFDVVVPVSYFLDTGYPGEANDPEIDTDLYVVSEIVVLDLASGAVKWRSRLRTTTKHSAYPGYLLASPVVIDIDANILLDVVVTTSDGMINVFDYRGVPHMGWPVQMAPIHGPALVEDVNSDGRLEVCAGDAAGTVACFSSRGVYLWDRHLTGEIADGMACGDVNGDGILDIVVGTSTGQLWALDGKEGKLLPGFPISLGSNDMRDDAAIVAPPLLINLNDTRPPLGPDHSVGLHIVVPVTDGHLYFVSGTTGCLERIDLGHASYTQVLAEDLIGNGKMALVVTTLSGAVHVIETHASYTPMKAWPSRPVGMNGYTVRENRIGIQVHDQFRHAHDVQGDHWTLAFDIVDRRYEGLAKVPLTGQHPLYFVIVTYGKRLIAFGGAYRDPGTYKIDIPAPPERLHTTVHVMMRVTGGQFVEDSFAMSFNAHVLDTAKFILVLPFLAIMCALWFVKKSHEITQEGSGMHALLLRRGPNGEVIRIVNPHDPWGVYMDEYELEEYLLALERERMLRTLRGKGALAGRYGEQAQQAARQRAQQHHRNQQQQQQQQQPKNNHVASSSPSFPAPPQEASSGLSQRHQQQQRPSAAPVQFDDDDV